MRYLTKEYWKLFEKTDGNRKDGKKFEELIQILLNSLYSDKKIVWEPTKITHDGNKDFIGKEDNNVKIWAECKNYKDNISLKVLAPTLIMAELDGIEEILFFSYSSINNNTKKKLTEYASIRTKKIFFYDDENLEQLLFKHKNNIFKQFFPNFKKNPPFNAYDPFVFSLCLPGLHQIESSYTNTTEVCVKLNELFFVGIGIENNCFSGNEKFKLEFDKINDLNFLEIIDNDFSSADRSKWKKEITILPGETILVKIYFRATLFKEKIKIPSIKVSCGKWNKVINFKKVTCDYLFNVPLMGATYLDILSNLYMNTINKTNLSLAIIHGKSGVGKTRLLYEALCEYKKNHYDILNFSINSNYKSNDSFQIIAELLSFIYNITPNMVIESKNSLEQYDFIINEHKIVMKILLGFYTNDDNAISYLFDNKTIIFEKILSQKIVMIIDNIQYANDRFIDFLFELSKYSINTQKHTGTVLLVSYNDDYYRSDALNNLIYLVDQEKNSSNFITYLKEITGMQDNNLSLGYIKNLIHSSKEEDDSFLKEIVKKANHNPKYIENIIEYLYDKNILGIASNYFIIKDTKQFYNIIDTLPNSFSNIFKLRFELFLDKEKVSNKDFKEILLIFSTIHFYSSLSKRLVKFYGLNTKWIKLLLKYNYIEQSIDNYLYFNHDLYENYFVNNYNLDSVFINYYIKNNFTNNYLNSWQEVLIYTENGSSFDEIIEIMKNNINICQQVPYKLKRFFYEQLIYFFTLTFNTNIDLEEYFDCLSYICLDAKNTLGLDFSKKLFDQIYEISLKISINKRECCESYKRFINEYTENLLQSDNSFVLEIYKERINYINGGSVSYNSSLLARLYNRIYVYYKNHKDEKTIHYLIEKSNEILKKNNLIGQQVENLYDEGNYYLYIPNKKDLLIKKWETGYNLYIKNKNNLEHLTLNSLKKKIQLDLLKNNYSNIELNIENALAYIELGKYNQQKLFFLSSVYFFKAVYGLITHNIFLDEIQDSIDLAAKYYSLKSNEKPYAILLLYAKIAFYRNNYRESLDYYDLALKNIKTDNRYYTYFRKIIKDDCLLKLLIIKKNRRFNEIKIGNRESDFDELINNVDILQLEEVEFQLQNFKSISNFTDSTGKEGFII